MFIHHRSPALIIKKENRGESDQLFTVYSKNFGKLKIFAKSIRKISSKLRADAEIFYLSDIEFIQAKNRKTLTDAIVIKKFKNIIKDLNRFKVACQVSEIIDSLASGQEKDAKIWKLLVAVFKKINDLRFPQENLFLIYHYFLWRFLFILGYNLELRHCFFCNKKIISETVYFSPAAGGIICHSCAEKHKGAKKIEPETIKAIKALILGDLNFAYNVRTNTRHLKSLENASKKYLSCVLAMTR